MSTGKNDSAILGKEGTHAADKKRLPGSIEKHSTRPKSVKRTA